MIPGEELLAVGQVAARRAGEVLQSWATKFSVKEKSCAADVVTEADLAAQHIIHETIQESFPGHGFLGEEGLLQPSQGDPYRWIIDPLDGTLNYVHQFPYYAVSIGVEHEGALVAGVIFDPTRNEMFTAARGEGAFSNGVPLQTSGAKSLSQALLVASFPPGVTSNSVPIQRFLKILGKVQSVQRTGSAALNLAYVAAGKLDGFWSGSLKPWDMAAGVLIVQEAGGTVTRMDGRPLDLEIPDLLATNGTRLHLALQNELQEI
ncbi:MAG: inositol monophosphatase family protein [Planctomycetales bacterium]